LSEKRRNAVSRSKSLRSREKTKVEGSGLRGESPRRILTRPLRERSCVVGRSSWKKIEDSSPATKGTQGIPCGNSEISGKTTLQESPIQTGGRDEMNQGRSDRGSRRRGLRRGNPPKKMLREKALFMEPQKNNPNPPQLWKGNRSFLAKTKGGAL